METRLLEQIRDSVRSKRSGLLDWLRATPPDKVQLRLGPAGEGALQKHLDTLQEAEERAADHTLGMCTICHDGVEPSLLEMDYTAQVCLAHLSEEQQRHLESDLELAQAVQRSLLPQHVPDTPALQIAAYTRPAQIIGGDYFGFFDFREGIPGLAIADVAGHGVAASLHMASTHTLLETLTGTTDSPAEVLQHMHRLFVHNANFKTFVTVFLGAYDPRTRTLTYCNAGHNPPLLIRGAGQAAQESCWLKPTAPAVGLIEDAIYRVASVEVAPGDVLLLYTDGVTEAVNSRYEEYGDERLERVVWLASALPAQDVLREVRQDLERFVDGQPLADDQTILVCKIRE